MRAAAAFCATAVLAVAGCGGADDQAGQYRHGNLSLTYPESWSRDAKVEDTDDLALYVEGPSGVAGVPYRLSLVDQPRERWTYRGYGKEVQYVRPRQLDSGLSVADGAFRFEGMHQAWRVVTDYLVKPTTGGAPEFGRIIDVVWLDGDRQVDLALAGPRDRMTAPAVKAIIASLQRDAPG